ncbi:MAG: DHH family phosphoesterase [Cetobacterium sp.]
MKYKLMKSDNPDIVLTVLENRDLTIDEANEIIEPSIEEYSPLLLKNVREGIQMLENAIEGNLNIGIVSDPDLDGATSTAILNDFITTHLEYDNVKLLLHIDYAKSHGIDNEIINRVLDNNIELLILPDAGSTIQDYNNILKLKEKTNIKVLILDHHQVEHNSNIEDVIIINPHQEGCEYPNKNLSGCAVTYKFIQAFCEGCIDIENKYIDLVSISIVADMMDLKNSLENRLLFNKGSLKENMSSPLIQDFCVAKGLSSEKLSIENIAFGISSNVNALIRVGKEQDKEYLLKSFYEKELVKSNKRGSLGAMEMIQDEIIRRMNNIKTSQDKTVKAAVEKVRKVIEDNNLLDDKVLMLDVDGLIDNSMGGLLANKIMNEIAQRPIYFYRRKKENPNVVGGSMRGIGIDSFKDVCEKSGLFNFLSGHKNAFGGEIEVSKLDDLRKYFNETLKDVDFITEIEVDAAYNQIVPLQDVIDIADMGDLWCNQIKEPKFIIQDVEIDTSKILKIGNATYSFKIGDMSFTKNFGSKVFIENFAKQEMYDKKEKFPFRQQTILADLLVRFRKNAQGYAYIDIIDAETKII